MPGGHRAVSVLYQALLTGLVLTLVTRRGVDEAAEFVFRLFRRQHLEKFRPGLAKLGLDRLPHAVACAQYHYLSNQLGGVKTEYVYESDRKAWVRYPPPRWIWDGSAICGIPSRVNAAEYDRDLHPDERVRFAAGEMMPDFDPARAPRLDSVIWPPERLDTVVSRYAMEYVRTMLPVLVELLGGGDTRRLLGHAARLIGTQHYDETARLLGVEGAGAVMFARYLAALTRAQGEEVEVEVAAGRSLVRQKGWRLTRGLPPLDATAFDAWCELWRGALAAHDRRLRLEVTRGDGGIDFVIG